MTVHPLSTPDFDPDLSSLTEKAGRLPNAFMACCIRWRVGGLRSIVHEIVTGNP